MKLVEIIYSDGKVHRDSTFYFSYFFSWSDFVMIAFLPLSKPILSWRKCSSSRRYSQFKHSLRTLTILTHHYWFKVSGTQKASLSESNIQIKGVEWFDNHKLVFTKATDIHFCELWLARITHNIQDSSKKKIKKNINLAQIAKISFQLQDEKWPTLLFQSKTSLTKHVRCSV